MKKQNLRFKQKSVSMGIAARLFAMLLIAICSIFLSGLVQNVHSQCKPCNDPEYIASKLNFYNQFQAYKDDISHGIMTSKPIDPSGRFEIDDKGNFQLIHNKQPILSDIPTFKSPLTGDLVSAYTFAQDVTTFTTIVGGSGTQSLVTGYCDDNEYAANAIGFTFTFNGTAYTTYNVTCNGTLLFGTYGGYYYPICYGVDVNTVCPFAADLEGNATGDGLYYQLSGTAPNRVFTVEWHNWGFYAASGADELSFQIKLFETTNAIQFIYQPHTPSYSGYPPQVGLGGLVSTTDYNTRANTTSWTTTTAGTNCSDMNYSSTCYPQTGLRYSWTLSTPPPPVPTLVRPVNHATGRPLYDTLQWNASSGATAYNLQIALDSLFTSMVYSDTNATSTAYIVGQFNPLTNWWWRVRAKNAGGWSAFTTQWVFKTMGPATGVTLITPANNAVNQPIASLLFNWTKATTQTLPFSVFPHLTINNTFKQPPAQPFTISNYWYALYTDTTAAAYLVDSTLTDTTKTVSGLTNNTNYWWKVKAKNEVGWGPFSGYFKFTTIPAIPTAPTLFSPSNDTVTYLTSLTLIWNASSGATSYRVQLSTDSTFNTNLLVNDSTVTSTSRAVTGLTGITKYYWRVNAKNVAGTSGYSAIWHFTVGLVGFSQNTNEIPTVYKLYNNYPNPFNPTSTIKFDIPKATDVKMVVFNVLGQEVSTLLNMHLAPGSYSVIWDATNDPSGVYFYRISAGTFTDIKKMVLVK